MPDTSLVLAIGVAAIYILFGPLVLLGIYIFLDRMAEGPDPQPYRRRQLPEEKEPALWTADDVRQYLKGRQKLK